LIYRLNSLFLIKKEAMYTNDPKGFPSILYRVPDPPPPPDDEEDDEEENPHP
jgi:hypothetical protein